MELEPPLLAFLLVRLSAASVLLLELVVRGHPEESRFGRLREVYRTKLLGVA